MPHYFPLQYRPRKYIMLCTLGIGHSSLLYSQNHPWPPVRMRYGVCLWVWNLTRVGSFFFYVVSDTVLLCIMVYWEFINISLVRTFTNSNWMIYSSRKITIYMHRTCVLGHLIHRESSGVCKCDCINRKKEATIFENNSEFICHLIIDKIFKMIR